jgi:hypothetical protein
MTQRRRARCAPTGAVSASRLHGRGKCRRSVSAGAAVAADLLLEGAEARRHVRIVLDRRSDERLTINQG